MDLNYGVKQSGPGAIPYDWELTSFYCVIDPLRPIRYGIVQPGRYVATGPLMLRSQDYSKGWTDPAIMHRAGPELVMQYQNGRLRYGDLVMTIVGANTGQVAEVPKWLDGAVLSRSTARIAIDTSKAVLGFIKAVLQSRLAKRQILDCLKEGAQPVVSCADISKFRFPLPPTLAEQEAIAEALSDADALIESLEQLLAKKRHIKQGAMQELLTGKRRLPGFKGGWVLKPIGDVLTIAHGRSQRDVEDRNGAFPILATGGQIGTANRFIYDKPSVLIGRKGTIDQPRYMDQPFWSVDTLFYSKIQEPNNAKFLFFRFCLVDWKTHNEASGVPSLNARTIERIEVEIPPPTEQRAIASVLTDIDTEIAALETKLTKARAIKQGMMQELLTGRIRLVRLKAATAKSASSGRALSRFHQPERNPEQVVEP